MKDKLKLVKELIRIQVAKILTEAKGVTQLKSDYDDAIKKEQALSSLMLMNLVKYKQAKASADEKAIAKFTKIAGQLSPKKKKASELANKAYQAYEDMISGMHADVELEIDEGRLTEAPMDKRFAKEWERNCKVLITHLEHEQRSSKLGAHKGTVKKMIDMLRTVKGYPDLMSHMFGMQESNLNESVLRGQLAGDSALDMADLLRRYGVKKILKQPNDSVTYLQLTDKGKGNKVVAMLKKMFGIKAQIDNHMYSPTPAVKFDNDQIAEGKVNEAKINWSTLHKDNEDYKYKKYVTKAFNEISDAMFNFRHSMGIKQLTNKDMKLKKKFEALQADIFALRREMKKDGLTEAKNNFMKMYPNSTDLEQDIVAWYRSLKKDIGEKYAKEMRADLVKALMKESKLTEGAKVKIGDVLYLGKRKGKVTKVMSDMANVDFGKGDVYGITFSRIKGDKIDEANRGKHKGRDLYSESKLNEAVAVTDNLIMKMKPGSTIKVKGVLLTKDKYGNWRSEKDPNDILVNRQIAKIAKGMKAHKAGNLHIIEGKLNEMEMNDPLLIAIRARKQEIAKAKAAPKVKKLTTTQYYKLMDLESDLIRKVKDAAKEFNQLDSDMNAEAGQKGADWSDADANRYGGDLDKLQTKVETLNAKRRKVMDAIKNYRMS